MLPKELPTNSGRKRLFIAFPIEFEQMGSSLNAAIKRTKINAQKREMEFHWVPNSNYHVTLVFLGNTNQDRIPLVQSILSRVAQDFAPFSTTLKGLGAFPDDRHMRVLWVGVRKSRGLETLQNALANEFSEHGFELDERVYSPHLTLGRLRKSRSGTDLLSPYVRTTFDDLTVSSLILYESVLHGPNPVYLPLSHHQLSGAATEEVSQG